MLKILLLVIGGSIGTLSRYLLSNTVHKVLGFRFHYATLTVNVIGCLIVGFLAGLGSGRFKLDANAQLFLTVGFCGAFTTFSTFMLETSNLIKLGENLHAFLNLSLCIVAGFLLFRVGIFLAELV